MTDKSSTALAIVMAVIDRIWEVLHPNEQRRVLELLVENITVSKNNVEVRFRANGIEQVVGELEPIGAEVDD